VPFDQIGVAVLVILQALQIKMLDLRHGSSTLMGEMHPLALIEVICESAGCCALLDWGCAVCGVYGADGVKEIDGGRRCLTVRTGRDLIADWIGAMTVRMPHWAGLR
jgi:hypothetical protein